MSQFNFRTVNAFSTLREVIEVLKRAMLGGLNCTGTVTLTANAGTTTIQDKRISSQSAVVLTPTTANAAGALATTYASTITPGDSFVLTHTNNAQADKTFNYAILG